MDFIYNAVDFLLPFSFLGSTFMKNAFITILLLSPLLGILSTMIVSNSMAFFSDSLGHGAFAGIAIGIILGTSPLLSIVIFSIIFACGITYIKEKSTSSTDTIIGVFSASGVSLGLISMSFGGNFRSYSSYFIGDILSITKEEIFYLFVTLLIVIIIWSFIYNKLLLISINSSLAKSRNISILLYEMIFATMVAIVVAISIQWVGLLVINALLVLPAAAARNLATNNRIYHLLSISFALCSGILGLFFSYQLNIATGATISLLAAILFFITLIYKKILL